MCRYGQLSCFVGRLVLLSLPTMTSAAFDQATTTPACAYFPLDVGTTWKYLVTVKVDEKADRPFVQTLVAEAAVDVNGVLAIPVGDVAYVLQENGVHAVAQRDGKGFVAIDRPQKVIPLKPRTSDAWTVSTKDETVYFTCMGTRAIKTDAGEFSAQCVVATSAVGSSGAADGTVRRETYRYYARGVGLVREKVTETRTRPDGSTTTRQTLRDLVSFTAPPPPPAPVGEGKQSFGSTSLRGCLLDPSGQPIALAGLLLRRVDKDEPVSLQTDALGRFAQDGLEPAGTYSLICDVPGYERTELPLHAGTGQKAAEVEVRLAPLPVTLSAAAGAGGEASGPVQELFNEGKQLAAAGKHAAALAKYTEALQRDPYQPAIHAYKAASHLALRQFDIAEREVDAALKLNDRDYSFHEIAGQVRLAQGDTKGGIAVYDKAAKQFPRNAGTIYLDLAAALTAQGGRASDIESALKSAAAAAPPSLEALFQLGQGYANAGRMEGKAYLQRYVELASKLPDAERDNHKIQVAKQMIRALDIVSQ